MIKDITLGQFFPGNSVIHRLDPRMKIILVMLYVIMLFVVNSAVGYLVLTVFTFVVIRLTKIPAVPALLTTVFVSFLLSPNLFTVVIKHYINSAFCIYLV